MIETLSGELWSQMVEPCASDSDEEGGSEDGGESEDENAGHRLTSARLGLLFVKLMVYKGGILYQLINWYILLWAGDQWRE